MDAAGATTTRRRGRRWKRLALVALSLVLALGLGELAVLVFVGEVPKFPRCVVGSDVGLRINLPDSHYRHKSADVTVWFDINQRGFRDERDFSYAKPAGRKRIVSLGDSFTIGYEVAVEATFSRVLQDELRAAGLDVEVINAGVSGYSNAEECLLLERELFKYDPDVVVVSYYVNDSIDNTRTGLFGLDEHDRLVQLKEDYVPLGGLADFLNRSRAALWFSERSNLFALLKESSTLVVKENLVEENLKDLDLLEQSGADERTEDGKPLRRRLLLVARIFDRIYEACRARGVPLIVQCIPALRENPLRLVDTFPRTYFELGRPGLHYLSGKELLTPFLGSELLYWTRSHKHWTPFSHAQSGKRLAQIVLEERLLEGAE